ncbi:transcription factor bHLH18-like [Nicotiana tabacum]|uniref:Transcription factor bHLH18-like n=1 Tax=Nicotiana tabacum TaxID=4097 RepID=A0A1S3X3M0_TOBAC|nr:transcription factor bHLH18-like [Nicotiana tomentosiformis]XP_016434421.1 PREDICTED: transcription factor bHLH18-like [Nicotiana tabacum]
MENASFNNLENTAGGEEPFEFKNLLSEMFTSYPNQNPSSSSLMEIPKIAFSSSPNSSTSTNSSSSSPNIISFGNPDSNFLGDELDYDMISEKVISQSSSPTTSMPKRICRSPLQSQDHLLAERKRRERFTQLFAVLAKSIPDLKKLDKASILEDSIKYIGELQGRVRALEEAGTTKSRNLIESTSTVQKQYSFAATTSDDNSILAKNFDESKPDQNDIKVQILDKNVLIGIHCSKEMRSIFTIIAGIMEKLHLTIHHIRVTPSNHIALHYISVLAEIDQNVDIRVQDVENAFKFALPSTSNMPGLAD